MPHSQGLPGSNDGAFSYTTPAARARVRYIAGGLSLCETRASCPYARIQARGRGAGKPERGVVGGMDAASPEVPVLTVALDLPSAHVLADQASIIQDLQFVMDCCKRLLAELARPEEDRDAVVPLALWWPTLAASARAGDSGWRLKMYEACLFMGQ